jgi:cholesterol oxidase
MVGCRNNAKNTLVKNYLYFAEQGGTHILPESLVSDIRPLEAGQADGARYIVAFHRSTGFVFHPEQRVRARNVILSAGSLGTQRLLFRREVTRSLRIRAWDCGAPTASRARATARTSRSTTADCITSLFQPDPVTAIEPVRYPKGSSLMRFLAGPLVESGGNIWRRLGRTLRKIIRHPVQFVNAHVLPGWAERTTILLVMQTEDNRLRMRLGRGLLTLFSWGLISIPDAEHNIPSRIDVGHQVTRDFAQHRQFSGGSVFRGHSTCDPALIPGVPFRLTEQEGVIDLVMSAQLPWLYVVDGWSCPPAGINPNLTITAPGRIRHQAPPRKEQSPDSKKTAPQT